MKIQPWIALVLSVPLWAQSTQSGTPIPANTWVMVKTAGFPVQVEGFGKLVYGAGFKRSVMLENYHQSGSEPNQALVGYNFASNRWDVLSVGDNFHTDTMPDGGHPSGMFAYNANQNTFVYPCCFSGSQATERANHFWWFDAAGLTGKDKYTNPAPYDLQAAGSFDPAHNAYVYFGNPGTWTYNPVSNMWQQKATSGTAPVSTNGFPSMVYNSANQKTYLFGGASGPSSDLYVYDMPANSWTKLAPTGPAPPARNMAAFAYDSANNVFIVYGGYDSNGVALNDTWIYNPDSNAWSAANPAQSPPVPGFASFGYLTYDSDNNVFVLVAPGSGGYANGSWGNYPAQVWLYRYAGTGPNAGTVVSDSYPPSGSVNKNVDGWANAPTLASSGSSLYVGWSEIGKPFDVTSATWPHVYASQLSGSSWVGLGGLYNSLDSENTANSQSHRPSMAIVDGTLWISWHKESGGTFAKFWNGSSWVGGAVGAGSTSALGPYPYFTANGPSRMAAVGTTPYIAFIENDRSFFPWNSLLYVKYWNGSSWSVRGSGPLNKSYNTAGDFADSFAIGSDDANPVVAWAEYTQANPNPQIYVSKWNGSSWVALGASLNVDATKGWASNPSIAYLNGQVYAAWIERAGTGANNQLYVKVWNGSTWSAVGSGSLNKNGNTGWSYRPTLATDNTSLYVGWVEQAATGEKPQVYVAKYGSGNWTAVGNSLNTDSVQGSAESVSLAILNGQPVAAWGEVALGSLRQVFVKQWNGSAWVSPVATAGAPTIPTSTIPTPTGVTTSLSSPSSITLTWNATTGAAGYKIYRNGIQVAVSSLPTFVDSGLAASTVYSYSVSAYDTSGNNSSQSSPVTATTQALATVVNLITGLPTTYNTAHPRLPHPDNAYLLSLYNSSAMAAYNATADAWDSSNPEPYIGVFRRLLTAYLANKAGGNTTRAATYLAKISALSANFNGAWGKLLLSANDGVGNGSYTITSQSANFLTGCGGGNCYGNWISVGTQFSWVNSVVDAHTITVNPNIPLVSGSSIQLRILDQNSGLSGGGMQLAMAYDWLYADLSPTAKTAFMNQIEAYVTGWEESWQGLNASPYSDTTYIRLQPDAMAAALAIYPDYDSANATGGTCSTKPCGTYHMNYAMDKWFKVLLPVWRQVMQGGGWHESWDAYINPPAGRGLDQWVVPSLLAWQVATGDPIFTRESWLKNFAYLSIYMTRPDFTMQHIGQTAGGYLTSEYNLGYNVGAGLGSIAGLGEIYDDPVIRGWARMLNGSPDGFEPSAWPFYAPDTPAKPAATRSSLPLTHNFSGWGVIDARSGWGEDDTDVTFKYGDNFWSHENADVGSFTISRRGNLAIDSGNYRPGTSSDHVFQYNKQTISKNTLTITDPNDFYPNEKYSMQTTGGTTLDLPLANDGGQRRIGSPYNALSSLCNGKCGSPADINAWNSAYDYFHMGTLLAYTSNANYTYAALDMTAAYNNPESITQPNSLNRTNRATSVIRNFLFMPPGYVIIFDQVNATNPAFKKKWLLHSVNQPKISGNRYQIDRTELVQAAPYSDLWIGRWGSMLTHQVGQTQYQYSGKLVGWMVQPTGSITAVGGPGKEFWIEDPKSPGTGANWSHCSPGQCTGTDWAFLSPGAADVIQPSPNYAPAELGSWRIEESPSTSQNQDYFLNVMLATNYEDTNVPATVLGTSDANTIGASWSDAKNTYTINFSRTGMGGHITVTGGTSINADLPTSMPVTPPPPTVSGCDVTGDGAVNAADVQAAINQALGTAVCSTADLDKNGTCDVVDIQRVITSALGGACVIGQ